MASHAVMEDAVSPLRNITLSPASRHIVQGDLLEFTRDPIICMRQLHKACGDLAVLEEDGQRLAFVFSPEYNRQVLSNPNTFHCQFFALRGSRRSAQRRVTSGLLSMNGAEHRENRRIMMDVFTRRFLPQYHETITALTNKFTSAWETGQTRDLNQEMVRLMQRMSNSLLFGIDDDRYSDELGDKIDRWVRQNHEVGLGAFVARPEFREQYDELLLLAEELERSVGEMLVRHRQTPHDRLDVLSLMMKAQQSEQQLSDERLIGHATLTFAAAHLTTAHTLSWTLFLLSQHPQAMQRLAAELESVGDKPDWTELQSLKWLDCVIRESMRLLPASSYSHRITSEPVSVGPLNLPKGAAVVFSQFITHHRPDLFEEPEEFRPERWLTINPGAYEYLPFGAGARRCIGADLAMMEIRTALSLILKQHHFQLQSGSQVDGRVVSTMLGPTSSVNAKLLPVEEIPVTVPVCGAIHQLMQLPEAATTPLHRAA